jgi:hypothetical protein
MLCRSHNLRIILIFSVSFSKSAKAADLGQVVGSSENEIR